MTYMGIGIFEKMIENIYGNPIKCELEYRRTYQYLSKYSINRKDESCFENESIRADKTIWICWLQGIKNAPDLVRICIESVKRNMPEDFDLVLLSGDNLYKYLKLPRYIYDKLHRGIITKTHFSDIIRAEILYLYGGCWVDATVYCSGKIPDYMLSGELFLFQWSVMDQSVLTISSWWIYAKKGSGLFRDIRNLLYNYWSKEQKLRNYYLFHIMFAKVVDGNSFYKSIIQSIPYFNNSTPHTLAARMPLPFNQQEWNIIKSQSDIHKLTYKNKILQGDIYNYYMALCDGKLI